LKERTDLRESVNNAELSRVQSFYEQQEQIVREFYNKQIELAKNNSQLQQSLEKQKQEKLQEIQQNRAQDSFKAAQQGLNQFEQITSSLIQASQARAEREISEQKERINAQIENLRQRKQAEIRQSADSAEERKAIEERYNKRIERLENERDKVEEKVNRREQQRMKELYQLQRAIQIATAITQAATAVTKALNAPFPQNLIQAATVTAQTAAQIARIRAQPANFYEGTEYVEGPGGRDQVPANLTKGEAVIPAQQNRDYAPAVQAIYNKDVPAPALNQFVRNFPTLQVGRAKADTVPAAPAGSQAQIPPEQLQRLEKALQQQEQTQVSVNADAKGFTTKVRKGLQETEYLDNRYTQ